MTNDIKKVFRNNGKSFTGLRSSLLDILGAASSPLSPKEIRDSFSLNKPDLASIYRNLSLMESLGIVDCVDLGEGFKRYEISRPESHRHHVICRSCGKIEDVHECGLQEMEKKIFRTTGFKTEKHRLEFFGVCAVCRK
ncbi:MAG: transcriptional repressor [Nitrospirota bacterium]|nr:transcriptional repressor [Nitrospirota bacterium]